ncbi:hypothetical protein ABVK25_007749 [Lepraria finkii]|uniref:Uncharacterized protein n=1 Tax=Lepraria finkii TaxID=1340010 RepID=A0ABR4B2C2_9LECA
MGITSVKRQLCEKTIKATREKCMVEIEKQTQELKDEKKPFWAEKGTVAELEHKYELSKAEKEGLKAENKALTEHNKELLELNDSLLEKLYETLDDSRFPKQDVEHKEKVTQSCAAPFQ